MAARLVYRPTHERVTFVRVTNEGQDRPGDPGTGVWLCAVRTDSGDMIQASAGELYWSSPGGKSRPFTRPGTPCPTCGTVQS